MALISNEAKLFLEAPNSSLAATRNAEHVPWCGRVVAVRCQPDARYVRVYLPATIADRPLADLRDNGELAVVTTHLMSNRSIQIKGRATATQTVPEADRPAIDGLWAAFVAMCEQMGLPRRITERFAYWPTVAIDVEVRELYEQTPGPGAGAPLTADRGPGQ